jgi:hypothetical protein
MSIHRRISLLCRAGWGRNSASVSVGVSREALRLPQSCSSSIFLSLEGDAAGQRKVGSPGSGGALRYRPIVLVVVLVLDFPFFFSVQCPASAERIEHEKDNEHEHNRNTNADTPVSRHAGTFPSPPDTDTGTDTSSSLAQKLRRELESFGQQSAPILI